MRQSHRAEDAPSRTEWLRTPILVFLVTRLGIMAIAYVSVSVIPTRRTTIYHLRGTENRLLDVFGSRWDTGFYVSIAEEGYRYEGVELPSVAFFPLLPILMRLLTPLVGDAVVAGILISNLALLAATIVLYRAVLDEWNAAAAERSIWYLSVFPASLFGSAIYTESLFLLTAIGAFFLARRGRWLGAGLVGVAAALTRLHGVLVAVLLAGEWWRQRRDPATGEAPARRTRDRGGHASGNRGVHALLLALVRRPVRVRDRGLGVGAGAEATLRHHGRGRPDSARRLVFGPSRRVHPRRQLDRPVGGARVSAARLRAARPRPMGRGSVRRARGQPLIRLGPADEPATLHVGPVPGVHPPRSCGESGRGSIGR